MLIPCQAPLLNRCMSLSYYSSLSLSLLIHLFEGERTTCVFCLQKHKCSVEGMKLFLKEGLYLVLMKTIVFNSDACIYSVAVKGFNSNEGWWQNIPLPVNNSANRGTDHQMASISIVLLKPMKKHWFTHPDFSLTILIYTS